MIAAWRRWVALLLLGGASSACGPQPPESDEALLFDGSRPYRILVEASRLGVGPRAGESRFLAGWRPWRYRDRLVLGGDPRGAGVRIVTLEARRRLLRLELLVAPDPPLTVVAEQDGRPLARGRSQGATLEISLPATLPAGIQTLTLRCLGDPPPAFDVVGAVLEPSHPPGEAVVEDGDLVQRGFSSVDVFVRVPPRAELVTAFRPPQAAATDQLFVATASAMDGSTVGSFHWSPTAERAAGRAIALPLFARHGGREARLVRVRFASLGDGPPGRWLTPRVRSDRRGRDAADDRVGTRSEAVTPTPGLVVLYVMDALRADSLDPGPDDSPGSAELRRLTGEGLVFGEHRSLAPSTLPSTRVLFTGSLRPIPAEAAQTHLGEAFRQAGYRTGLFSGNPFVSGELALDRGFEVAPQSTHFDLHALRMPTPYNNNAEVVHAAALDWLDSLPRDSRVFLYVHTMHPHNPYAPPAAIRQRMVGDSASEIDGSSLTLLGIRDGSIPVQAADVGKIRALYAASVAYNLVELRAFLDRLEERFDRRDTLLVLTSDHGEELFDHDGVLHGYTLYEELLRIPLVVWWPGTVRPGRSDRPTTTLDLRRTLLELLQAEDHAPLIGRSLLPLLLRPEDDAAWDDRLLVAAAPDVRGGLLAVRQGPWKLVFAGASPNGWGMGQGRGRSWDAEYLFDLRRDPDERLNLVGAGGSWEDWLRTRLERWSETVEASGVAEKPPDEELRRRLETLGYLE